SNRHTRTYCISAPNRRKKYGVEKLICSILFDRSKKGEEEERLGLDRLRALCMFSYLSDELRGKEEKNQKASAGIRIHAPLTEASSLHAVLNLHRSCAPLTLLLYLIPDTKVNAHTFTYSTFTRKDLLRRSLFIPS